MKHLYFRVADALFLLQFSESTDIRPLIPSCAPFNIPPVKEVPMFEMTVGHDLVSQEPVGKEIGQFDCGGINHGMYKTEEGYKILISSPEKELSCSMETNEEFSTCRVSLFGDYNNQSFGLNNAMMIAFAFSGAYHDIILMHASVTIYDNKGYLFLGKSGTGKSTHSQLWHKYISGSELLNDDNPALRFFPKEGKVRVYGTPWSGKTPCYRNLSVETGAFLRLEQYPENLINKEPGIKAFASILSSCSTMIWDKCSYARICDTVASIVERIPAYYLRCRPDEAAARLSHQAITR
ncbi:hypothetical protein [Bacteroides acidifaciens]|uniref:hypothetical protein n=1 Tax=Bacteroides acidifaciens TaxID=85831 RepID=UPI002714C4EE|nr:hypothetical protein [Bacteroides acidifaciens]HRF86188.1 hypothetical protein [Alloprevotella sp.]